MPRLAGVDIPNNKQIQISLTYIHGIGRSTANRILQQAGIAVLGQANLIQAQVLELLK